MNSSTLTLALSFIVACSEAPPHSTLSKIIGDNDLVLVAADGSNVSDRYIGRLNAFAQILPVGCTGTHIGNGIVLTAGHCVNGGVEYFERREAFDCQDVTLEFGKIQGTSPVSTPCLEWIAAEYTADRDYAYLRVEPMHAIRNQGRAEARS